MAEQRDGKVEEGWMMRETNLRHRYHFHQVDTEV